MNKPSQIAASTINLFLYDLQEGLGQNPDSINLNREHFWRRIEPKLDKNRLDELAKCEQPESDLVPLYKPDSFRKIGDFLDGYYLPLQLGDTYALVVDCSGTEGKNDDLGQIKTIITDKFPNVQGKIGQTWLIWGQLPNNCPDDKIEQIAKDCYLEVARNQLDWEEDKLQEKPDKFLGGYLYELWRPPAKWLDLEQVDKLKEPQRSEVLNQPIENYHYLIWLFPKDVPVDEIGQIHAHLIRLFCYRNKIIWAYYQSRSLKDKLKANYSEIQKLVREFTKNKKNLSELQNTLTQTLDILADYAVRLSQINTQGRTIAVNLENYQDRLEILKGYNQGNVPESFKKFADFAAKKYQRQIEADYANLSPGMTLLENLIKTVEGIVEINQAKSDRALTYTVGVASIGLALSGVTATLISTQLPSAPTSISTQLPSAPTPISTQLPSAPTLKNQDNPISLPAAFAWSLIPSFILIVIAIFWRKLRSF